MDLTSNHIIGVEALLRWQHPDLGVIMPDKFISVAEENKLILESKGYKVAFDNFLKWNPGVKFDRIIMNPPFWNQADIIHVMHAYSLLKKGGRLVSVMSNGVTFRDNQNTNDFRKLIENNGLIKNLPENSFKDAGTNVKTVIVILSKEAVKE